MYVGFEAVVKSTNKDHQTRGQKWLKMRGNLLLMLLNPPATQGQLQALDLQQWSCVRRLNARGLEDSAGLLLLQETGPVGRRQRVA